MKRVLIYISALFLMLIFGGVEIQAYSEVCNESYVETGDFTYGVCHKNLIYLMPENKEKSSFLVASRGYDSDNVILYAGVVDGLETFYARSFSYYGVAYDDASLLAVKNDMWYDILIDDVLVYNAYFDDSIIGNQSKEGFHLTYNQVGTYIIRQYISGEFISAIRVIVVNKHDFGIRVSGAYIGEESFYSTPELVYGEYDLKFSLSEAVYGYQNKADVVVNSCSLQVDYASTIKVDKSLLKGCFIENKKNKVSLTIYNGFGKAKTVDYYAQMSSETVSIEMESSISAQVNTSKRFVINAKAGVGNELDENYNLYYWSTSSDDELTYEAFMENYENSENKGTYSSSKGVILREKEGTYYLYALAKDNESFVVVRSEECVMEKKPVLNSIILSDIAVVLLLLALAALPIFVYLKVREGDTK